MSTPPAADAVRAQLERVLSSAGFSGSARLSRFLRFVVERSLAGQGDQLKEYTLGTEVFDRPNDYDPRLDSIVRVEARRLRSKLAEYYEGPGADAPLVIRIDKGSYVAAFDTAPATAPAAATPAPTEITPTPLPAPAATATVPAWRRNAWSSTVIALGVLAIAVLLWREFDRVRDGRLHASSRIGVAVLPLVRYDAAGASTTDAIADSVTDGIIGELARRPGVEVASRTTVMQYRDLRASLSAIGADLGVRAVVEGRVQLTGTRLWVEVRLVDAVRDRKVWVDDFAGDTSDQRALERRIAAAIGDVVVTRLGAAAPVE